MSAQLRLHWTEGRLDADELEARLAAAVAAQRTDDLAALVRDLPAVEIVSRPDTPARVPKLGLPGIRPFTQRIEVPASAQRVRDLALDSLAGGLNGAGFELVRQSAAGMDFRRGTKERVHIDIEPRGPRRTMMIIHGRATRRVRKQFAQLRFGPDPAPCASTAGTLAACTWRRRRRTARRSSG